MNTEKGSAELQKLFSGYILKAAAGDKWPTPLLENAERVSAPLVVRMLEQIGLTADTTQPFRLVDNGCGVGVTAGELQRLIKPEVMKESSVLCGDFPEMMVGLVKERIESEGWVNTTAERIDAQSSGLETDSFTHVTLNIAFHVIPDSEAALDDSIRILKPGGQLGFTTWHLLPGFVADLEAAFKSFPFDAPFQWVLQTTPWGDWANANWVKKTLVVKGLEDVKVNLLAHLSRVAGPDEFISHFSMVITWLMNSSWSDELRKEHPEEEVFGLIKEFLGKKYDGKGWDTTWVSLIASGRVPA